MQLDLFHKAAKSKWANSRNCIIPNVNCLGENAASNAENTNIMIKTSTHML